MTSSEVTLFRHWICPFSVRVESALAHRAIPYRVVDVPPSAVRPHGFVVPQEFVERSPKREIPMIRIGEEYLADSIPILERLEERIDGDPLLPRDLASMALVRERMKWTDEHLYRPMIGVYCRTDPERVAQASDGFGDALAAIDEWLRASPWIAGSAPSLTEALMVAVYVRLDGLRRLGLTTEVPSNIRAHIDRYKILRGWATVEWSDTQIDEFVARFEKYRARQRVGGRRDGTARDSATQ